MNVRQIKNDHSILCCRNPFNFLFLLVAGGVIDPSVREMNLLHLALVQSDPATYTGKTYPEPDSQDKDLPSQETLAEWYCVPGGAVIYMDVEDREASEVQEVISSDVTITYETATCVTIPSLQMVSFAWSN